MEGDRDRDRAGEGKRETQGIRDVERNNESRMNQAEQTKSRGMLGNLNPVNQQVCLQGRDQTQIPRSSFHSHFGVKLTPSHLQFLSSVDLFTLALSNTPANWSQTQRKL